MPDLRAEVATRFPGWALDQVLGLRHGPDGAKVGTYRLRPADGVGPPTIGVVELGPQGVAVRSYLDDPALPGLAALADGSLAAARLGAATCSVTPVRYRPGARCVLALRTEDRCLFAKVLTRGDERLWATTCALHDALGSAAVPAPVAWWPDLGVVVQEEVAGATPFGPVATGQPTLAALAGATLARVHAVPPDATDFGAVRTLDHLLAEVGEHRAGVAAAAVGGGVTDAFDDALAVLSRAAAGAPSAGAPVVSHGSYRLGQLVLDQAGRVVLLDLDGVCRAEPALDTGNLLAYVAWQAIRQPEREAALDQVRRSFLAGYASVAPPPLSARLDLGQAASMVRIAGRRVRDLTVDEWPRLRTLIDAATALVR